MVNNEVKEIVSAQWLNDHLNHPNLIILDATLETSADGTRSKMAGLTIPHARRFDLKNIFSDQESPFPNTVPQPNQFELECRKLGINTDSNIVVFDDQGVYSSPRVWWLFHVMGHQNTSVLDGGLPEWIQHGFQTSEQHDTSFDSGNFIADFHPELVVSFGQVKRNGDPPDFVIVDARSSGRFNGTEAEPRKHLKSGKIPQSINIPYPEVLSNGQFKKQRELKELFAQCDTGNQELVFSCGSGLTACIVMLAQVIASGKSKKVYDGSWTEWAELNLLYSDDAGI